MSTSNPREVALAVLLCAIVALWVVASAIFILLNTGHPLETLKIYGVHAILVGIVCSILIAFIKLITECSRCIGEQSLDQDAEMISFGYILPSTV